MFGPGRELSRRRSKPEGNATDCRARLKGARAGALRRTYRSRSSRWWSASTLLRIVTVFVLRDPLGQPLFAFFRLRDEGENSS